MRLFGKKKRIPRLPKEELERIAHEIAEIRLRLPESSGYLDMFINEVRHYGEEINHFDDMVFTANRFVQITAEMGREASVRDVEYAWDGIAGFSA